MAYAIPASFGKDDNSHRRLLDLGFGHGSKRRVFIESTELSCFTAYEWSSPVSWKSVVLTGVLRRLEDIDPANELSFFAEATSIEITVFDLAPEPTRSNAPEGDDTNGRDDGQ